MIPKLARIFLILSLLTLPAGLGYAQSGAHWTYSGEEGPLRWGKLDPAYKLCGEGHEQSPIDIRAAKLDKALQPIEFHYLSSAMDLVNNGHSVQVNVPPGSYIVANGARYELVQFHFHHPSEEAVKGKLSDMVIHLVHKSAEGKLAVVAIRLTEGHANTILAALWEHLPTKPGATDKSTELLNPAGLLPEDRGYYTFMGSLTTPPCTEGVRWFVLEQEAEISRDQLKAFAALYRVNSRPLQGLHGRKVEASE